MNLANRVRLPKSGRFARVFVGWNPTTEFSFMCYERHAEVSASGSGLSSIALLQQALGALGLGLPNLVTLYLCALRLRDEEEVRRLAAELGDLLETGPDTAS